VNESTLKREQRLFQKDKKKKIKVISNIKKERKKRERKGKTYGIAGSSGLR